MNTFIIEYESYQGNIDSMTINADTEADAKRIFYAKRPLSDIKKIERYDY